MKPPPCGAGTARSGISRLPTHHAQTLRGSITDRATAFDVLRLAEFEGPNRGGMIRCPIHLERSASFHLLGGGFRCFGCGAHGGVLELVIALGIAHDRGAAARWLEEALHE